MEMFIYALALIGLFSLVTLVYVVLMSICDNIKLWIHRLKRKYQYKHRFDKPPTAKCYCVDCLLHDTESGKCELFEGRRTADNWFCWRAEPSCNFVD